MPRLFAILSGLVLFLFAEHSWAAKYVPPPIAGYVTDTAGKLSPQEIQALDQKLSDYRKCSSNHVVVFLPGTLAGNSIEDVGYDTGNAWHVGDAKKDNGVILILAPNERKIRIETGKGVGGDLTDLESSHILREVVGPNMKEEKFFAAADQATTRIGKALGGCPIADIGMSPTPNFKPATTTTGDQPVYPKAPPPTKSSWSDDFRMLSTFGFAALIGFLVMVSNFIKREYFSGLVTGFIAFVFSILLLGATSPWLGIIGVLLMLMLIILALRSRNNPTTSWSSGGSDWTTGSSTSSWSSSSSSSDWSSSSSSSTSNDWPSGGSSGGGSDYSGGGGSFGGGGSSDSY